MMQHTLRLHWGVLRQKAVALAALGLVATVLLNAHAVTLEEEERGVLINGADGIRVTAQEVRNEALILLPEARRRCQMMTKAINVETLTKSLYLEKVLTLRAVREGLTPEGTMSLPQAAVLQRDTQLVQAWWKAFERRAAPQDSVLESMAKAKYHALGEENLQVPEKARVRLVRVDRVQAEDMQAVQARANALLQKLQQGILDLQVPELADRKKGDGIWKGVSVEQVVDIPLAQMSSEEQQALDRMDGDGRFVGPFKNADKGFYLLLREKSIPARVASFEEVRGPLMDEMRQRLQTRAKEEEQARILSEARLGESAIAALAWQWKGEDACSETPQDEAPDRAATH